MYTDNNLLRVLFQNLSQLSSQVDEAAAVKAELSPHVWVAAFAICTHEPYLPLQQHEVVAKSSHIVLLQMNI